jgi:hypothetical protein
MRFQSPFVRRDGKRKSLGQSLVEFTVLLPILLLMISGLIEFGFLLNYYLDLIDAAREAARYAADMDPIRLLDGTYTPQNNQFYLDTQNLAKQSLKTASDNRMDWITPPNDDCANIHGDIVVSAFGVLNNGASYTVTRFPPAYGENGVSLCGHYASKISSADIAARLNISAPTTGLVLVEIYYEYHQILGLPWIRAFVPDPVVLHAYSIMPNTAVEPTPTPVP